MINSSPNQTIKAHEEELVYCRQYILGPDFIKVMPGWKYIDIDHGLKLSCHPELEVEQIAHADKKLTVIGNILDSLDPAKSNRDILIELINKVDGIHALTRASGQYGGRWILIAMFGNDKYLFSDALGFRQVFYTQPDTTGALWMVSQAGLAEKWLNLETDAEAESFMDSLYFRKRDQVYWPAAATAFRGLTHLLPNHYLDLSNGMKHRYWPYEPIGTMSTKDAEEFLEYRMKNIMQSAALRYPLAIGITAGIDSRVVMACAKDICHEIDFVTIRQRKMPDDDPDITVPGKLCRNYGLHHVVVKGQPGMSADFAKLFKDNAYMATDIYGTDAEAIINKLQRKKAVVTGTAGEIGQCFFRRKFPKIKYNGPVDAPELAVMQGYPDEPFAIKHFQAWLDGANNRYNVKLMDLFYWEHSHGNWAAMTQLQFDLAWREIFTPYNCRDVLQAFLSVEECDRTEPRYLLYRNIIARSWPELLDQPVNPREKSKLGVKKISNFLKRKIKYLRRS